MNGLRKSARVNTSTINVKLNDNNEIEFLTVRSDDEDDEDEAEDDEEEEEEELIENADGSLSIKITEKKPKPKRLPLHHICAKCSKVFSTPAVRIAEAPIIPKFNILHSFRHTVYCNWAFWNCLQSLKRHLNLCKNLPKDDVTLEKEEFDLSSMIDLNDPVYDTVCFCCNEDKTTAHVSTVEYRLVLSFDLASVHNFSVFCLVVYCSMAMSAATSVQNHSNPMSAWNDI